MTTGSIHLEFCCPVCSFLIVGDYEEEDFESLFFCPKHGGQIALPRPELQATRIPESPATPAPSVRESPAARRASPSVSSPTVPAIAARTPTAPQHAPPVVATPPARPLVEPAPPVVAAPPLRSTGRLAWRFPTERKTSLAVGLRNCPAIDAQGRIIVALRRDLVALVPQADGCEVAWRFTAADDIPGSPAIGANGVVFAHSSDGLLHALDANGKPVRPPTKVGAALGWATPLVDADHQVWISAAAGGLIRVDSQGKTAVRPFVRHPNRFDCTGALVGKTLYIGSEDQFVHAIELSGDRGRELWNQREKVGLTGWYVNSAIALATGPLVIAVSRDDHAYAFRADGSIAWQRGLNGCAIGSPVVSAAGQVIIGLAVRAADSATRRGRVISLDVQQGDTLWSSDVEHPIESTPVIGEGGEIYLGDNGGQVHALNPAGERLWSESVGAAVRSAGTLLTAGLVLFGSDDGSLVALRCESKGLGGGWPKLLGTAENRCAG